jgi:hypothetical protein
MPNSETGSGSSDSYLESKLAAFVRSYISASRDRDSSEQQEALRWTCCGLEWLLGGVLQGSQGWGGWVDGISPAMDMLPDSVNVISAVELSLRGSALWGKSARGPFWIEPFFASVRISETVDEILSYELRFADAARGLGQVPNGKHLRRADWFFPAEWLFTFSKP